MVLQSRVRRFAMHWLRMTQRSRVQSLDEKENPTFSHSIYSPAENNNNLVTRLSSTGEFVPVNKMFKRNDACRITGDSKSSRR